MDALISRQCEQLLMAAKSVCEDQSLPVVDKLVGAVLSLSFKQSDAGEQMLEHINKPQNALMHQKMQRALIAEVTPILAGIIQEGVDQGLFDTPFPCECMEMVVAYVSTVFDDDLLPLSQEEMLERALALFYNVERMLGVASGSLSVHLMRVFQESSA
jgi:hypothetical protein